MVAIVSGNALGLETTSLATLGQRGVFGNAGMGQGTDRVYVNIATGNLVIQDTDDRLVSQGTSFEVVRTYNSQGSLGDNWSSTLGANGSLKLNGNANTTGSTVALTRPDGATVLFTYDSAQGGYVTREGDGAFDTLKYYQNGSSDRSFTWTDGSSGAWAIYARQGDGSYLMTSSADAAGNKFTYTYGNGQRLEAVTAMTGTGVADTIDYVYGSGNQLSSVNFVSGADSARNYRVSYTYDGNGNLIGMTQTQSGSEPMNSVRTYVNDASGKTLYANDNGHVQRQLIVNAEVLGRYGETVDTKNSTATKTAYTTTADFSFAYQATAGNTPVMAPTTRTVAQGDTLQSIAQAVYGDNNLWYRIAEANGIAGNDALKVGQVLTIPAVQTSSNNINTFSRYDLSHVIGSSTPTLPTPYGDKDCGGLGEIVQMAITIVVTAYAGPTAGNLAGQIFGDATGMQDGINWKSVAMSAVGEGMSQVMPPIPMPDTMGPTAQSMTRAAIMNAATQGIGVATGLQDSFSWRAVAASAVGAGVGSKVGSMMPSDADPVMARGFTGFMAGTATAIARGGRVAVLQVASDAFGNALGESLAEPSSALQPALTTGDFARMDGESYRSTPYDIPNAGGGLQFGRSSYGLQRTPGASIAMDEGIRDARGQQILVAMRDADINAEAARSIALAQRAAQPTAQVADAGGGRGFVSPGWVNPYASAASVQGPAMRGLASSTDRVGNWLNSFSLPEVPGVGWLSREQGLSSAQYWQRRLDETGNPLYAVAQGMAKLWGEHLDEVGMALSVRGSATKGIAESTKQAADLSRHLGYIEKYGANGVQQLESGRFRYYGEVQPASKTGEMVGRRYVHEFDPVSGGSRGWHETVDQAGTVRQVRPELNNGTKTHYRFDGNGNYTGSW